jgi:drug/metabolite transporter (DMT)-like permease
MNFKKISKERTGELLMLVQILIGAITPVFIKGSEDQIPPFFFAGTSMIVASLIFLPILFKQKKINQIYDRKALPFMLVGTFLLMVIMFPMKYLAGQQTTAGNIAILSQSEILFTLLVFGFLRIEKVNRRRILGASIVVLGILIVLFKDFSGQLNVWDILIVSGTIVAPFANIFQKKTVKIVSPMAYLTFRNLFGGLIVLIISLYWENVQFDSIFNQKIILFIVINGLIAFALKRILILYAMKIDDISKIITLNGASVAATLLLAFIFLKEIPTVYQIIGFLIIMFGVSKVIKKTRINKKFFLRK